MTTPCHGPEDHNVNIKYFLILVIKPTRCTNFSNFILLYSKNKFEKLAHLAGFIIRIYHDAWSSKR